MPHFQTVILGAGAAGLMCAIEAGKRGRCVLLLDHADSIGKKILISGGGRCNFTNIHCSAENFLSANPHFAKSALARFTPSDMIALVEKHGIPYHEKTLGQLFCDRAARDITNLLERECASAHVQIQLNTEILQVAKDAHGFLLTTSTGTLRADSVIVATGGLSIPKMGATGIGYDIARHFDLKIIDPRPALVPFTFDPETKDRWCDLSGVSAAVTATLRKQPSDRHARRTQKPPVFREKLLITHRGLSGPAILQISSFWSPGDALQLDLAPGRKLFAPLLQANAPRDLSAVLTPLRTVLPTRWAERWLAHHMPQNVDAMRSLPNSTITQLEDHIHAWSVTPAGTEGYAKAEVTAGGVDTAELDPRTLESRKVPGLYFIGEVVDVTGWLGGFNFQWAWASGFCAGQVC